MTHAEALASLAGHPHAWRFRQLCEDDSDPERRDAYRALVVRMACGDPMPAMIPVAASLALTRAMNACAFRSRGAGCGCEAKCALKGRAVNHAECFECLKEFPS